MHYAQSSIIALHPQQHHAYSFGFKEPYRGALTCAQMCCTHLLWHPAVRMGPPSHCGRDGNGVAVLSGAALSEADEDLQNCIIIQMGWDGAKFHIDISISISLDNSMSFPSESSWTRPVAKTSGSRGILSRSRCTPSGPYPPFQFMTANVFGHCTAHVPCVRMVRKTLYRIFLSRAFRELLRERGGNRCPLCDRPPPSFSCILPPPL